MIAVPLISHSILPSDDFLGHPSGKMVSLDAASVLSWASYYTRPRMRM